MLEVIKEWLKFKFHIHNWETIEVRLVRVFDDFIDYPIRTEKVYIQRCKICNKIRRIRIKC